MSRYSRELILQNEEGMISVNKLSETEKNFSEGGGGGSSPRRKLKRRSRYSRFSKESRSMPVKKLQERFKEDKRLMLNSQFGIRPWILLLERSRDIRMSAVDMIRGNSFILQEDKYNEER